MRKVRRERFPVFCKGIGRTETIGRQELRQEDANIPVTVGGVLVEPGDFVMGDDGVVVIPRALPMWFPKGLLNSSKMTARPRGRILINSAFGSNEVIGWGSGR